VGRGIFPGLSPSTVWKCAASPQPPPPSRLPVVAETAEEGRGWISPLADGVASFPPSLTGGQALRRAGDGRPRSERGRAAPVVVGAVEEATRCGARGGLGARGYVGCRAGQGTGGGRNGTHANCQSPCCVRSKSDEIRIPNHFMPWAVFKVKGFGQLELWALTSSSPGVKSKKIRSFFDLHSKEIDNSHVFHSGCFLPPPWGRASDLLCMSACGCSAGGWRRLFLLLLLNSSRRAEPVGVGLRGEGSRGAG
jgi:hypothetical protein